MDESITIRALRGSSAGREVLLGFAPANLLHALSFADVLNEDTGRGYQRRINPRHSLDFRRYIKRSASTTIPLTFNLRPRDDLAWRVAPESDGSVLLVLSLTCGRIMSQVDCQHRLGHIGDLDLTLPFMVFLGLTEREEMEVFNVINSKAKGLSSSLLDYHEAQLATDLGKERPELLIALHLNDAAESPWLKQLDLGGSATSGNYRRASLRTMQKAVKRFLASTNVLQTTSAEDAARLVLEFWIAVVLVLEEAWKHPRRHFLTKGIGVYALMGLLGDFVNEVNGRHGELDRNRFAELLSDFAVEFDWTSAGPLKGLGGETGADRALGLIREARLTRTSAIRVGANGQ